MYDVITIGAATQDVFLTSDEFRLVASRTPRCTLECFPVGEKISVKNIGWGTGGGATNAAATFHNLGFRVGMVAKVGDDGVGKLVLRDLRQRGIPLHFVRIVPGGATAFSSVLLTPRGDRTALVHRGVASTLSREDIPWEKLRAQWLFVTSVGGNTSLLARLFRVARDRGVRVAFNPGDLELKQGLSALYRACGSAEVLFLNRTEAAMLTGGSSSIKKLGSVLRARLSCKVVITDGAKGAYYWDGVHAMHALSPQARVVNTTGAGDAFGSGFISGILRWRDARQALQLATLNALGTIQAMGAKNGLLTHWPSIRELMRVKVSHL